MADYQYEVVIQAPYRDTVKHFLTFLDGDVDPGVTSEARRIGRNTFVQREHEAEMTEMIGMMTDLDAAKALEESTLTTTYTLTAVPGGTKVSATMQVPDLLEQLFTMGAMLAGEPHPLKGAALDQAVADWGRRASHAIQVQKAVADRSKGGLE